MTVASAGGLPDDVVNLLRKGSACTQEELTGLEEKLISLKVDTLRALSQCFGVKRSSGAKKAVLIGRLLSYCELGILKDVTEEGERSEDDGVKMVKMVVNVVKMTETHTATRDMPPPKRRLCSRLCLISRRLLPVGRKT